MNNQFHKIGGQYYLTNWEGNLLQQMEIVGLMFHIMPNKAIDLIGYGKDEIVRENFNNVKTEINHKIMIFSGQFKVKDLNKLVSDDSYAEKFYNKLLWEYKEQKNA